MVPNQGPKHEGLPVKGYVAQDQENVDLVNQNKTLEAKLLKRLEKLGGYSHLDQRWLSVAKTHFEQGFMALNRAIFQPQPVEVDDEDDGA